MRLLLTAASGLALALALPTGSAVAGGPELPTLTREGPYGDPLALRPALLPALFDTSPGVLGEAAFTAAPAPSGTGDVPARILSRGTSASAVAKVNPEEDDNLPAKPGTFKQAPMKLPGVFMKTRLTAPHLNPDLEVPLSRQTTVGVFTEIGKVEVDQRAGIIPTVRARDLGAGLSMQYRFGQ